MRAKRSPVYSGVFAVLMLGLTACGGGGAAPSPSAAPAQNSGAAPGPSPARPALASPAPSASPGIAAATPTTGSTAGGETYEVQSGDTLATISQQFYGDPTQWQRIYDANKDAIGSNPDELKLGTKLTIPPKQS